MYNNYTCALDSVVVILNYRYRNNRIGHGKTDEVTIVYRGDINKCHEQLRKDLNEVAGLEFYSVVDFSNANSNPRYYTKNL